MHGRSTTMGLAIASSETHKAIMSKKCQTSLNTTLTIIFLYTDIFI